MICKGRDREISPRRRYLSSSEGGEEMGPMDIWEEHSKQREPQVQGP